MWTFLPRWKDQTVIRDSVPLCLLFSYEHEDNHTCHEVIVQVNSVPTKSPQVPRTWQVFRWANIDGAPVSMSGTLLDAKDLTVSKIDLTEFILGVAMKWVLFIMYIIIIIT